MNCPIDNQELDPINFHNVEADYCSKCLSMWFDKDELRYAKDDKDKSLNWMDVDLWRDKRKFEITERDMHCPRCRTGLVEVQYDDSKVKIDFCKMCQGIWLDRGEFKQIINYLKNKADYEILNHYSKNSMKELWEVFAGPETLREEVNDFVTLLKLFNYKFLAQHSHLVDLIGKLPK